MQIKWIACGLRSFTKKITKMISNWSLNECRIAYNSLIDIVDNNHNHYYNNYVGLDLQNFLGTTDF